MKTKNLVAGLALIFSANSMAALVIDYTGNDKPVPTKNTSATEFSKQSLLLDNSIVWATFVESDKCLDKVLSGSGTNLPLDMALRMITPNGWKVYADEGVTLDKTFVSWQNGALWTKVVADAAEKNKIKVNFNCGKKELTIQNAPDLGQIANETSATNTAFDPMPESEYVEPKAVVSTDSVSVSTPLNGVALQEEQAPTNVFNTQSIEPVPYGQETAGSYLTRYAAHYGFDRVAYRFKKIDGNQFMRMSVTTGNKTKTFSEFLRNNNLIQVNGVDAVSNAAVMIVSDDPAVANRSDLLVFQVKEGMVSENAVSLAQVTGHKIGTDNLWPRAELGVDYKVPYTYDIVITEPIDGFAQLFASYPIQAQLILGSKNVYVVKRHTANRNK